MLRSFEKGTIVRPNGIMNMSGGHDHGRATKRPVGKMASIICASPANQQADKPCLRKSSRRRSLKKLN